jgi:hypothetical protein
MCLSHLIYTVWPCLIHTGHAAPMPCSNHAVLLKATAQDGRQETASGPRPAFSFFRLPRRFPRRLSEAYESQMQVASVKPNRLSWTRKRVLAAHYKKDALLNCWTSSSDISGYHVDFHEGHGTVGAGQWRGMARVN